MCTRCINKHSYARISCDLDLDPMTLKYELEVDILKMYLHTKLAVSTKGQTD